MNSFTKRCPGCVTIIGHRETRCVPCNNKERDRATARAGYPGGKGVDELEHSIKKHVFELLSTAKPKPWCEGGLKMLTEALSQYAPDLPTVGLSGVSLYDVDDRKTDPVVSSFSINPPLKPPPEKAAAPAAPELKKAFDSLTWHEKPRLFPSSGDAYFRVEDDTIRVYDGVKWCSLAFFEPPPEEQSPSATPLEKLKVLLTEAQGQDLDLQAMVLGLTRKPGAFYKYVGPTGLTRGKTPAESDEMLRFRCLEALDAGELKL